MIYCGVKLKPGDKVTVLDRFGKERTGKVQGLLVFDTHVVLNMGGKYGTPQVADATNIVRVKVR